MKRIINIMTILIVVIVCFAACQDDAIEPLEGKFPPPEDYALTNLVSQQMQKTGSTRVFTLKVATDGVSATYNPETFIYTFSGTGYYISIDFVGRDYFLKPGAYSVAPKESAKAGNYIAGYDSDLGDGTVLTNSGTCFFEISNGAETGLKIDAGLIFVAKDGDNYAITGRLELENTTFVNIKALVAIEYIPDIEYTYSVETVKPYSFTLDGTTFTNVDGSQLNKVTIDADGNAIAYFEIVTEENPVSLSGTYPVKSVNSLERAVCQGQYLDLAWFGVTGIPAIESGSYLVGDSDKEFMREGSLTIEDNNGTLNIIGTDLKIQDISTKSNFGVLPDVKNFDWENVKPGGSDSFPQLISASALDLSLFGMSGFTVTVKVATASLVVTPGEGGNPPVYSGNGQYISVDFSRDAASLPEGVYNIVGWSSAAVNECPSGHLQAGYGNIGALVGNVVDGVVTEEFVTGGYVEVTTNGISFNLETESGTITGSCIGEIVLQ